YGAGGTAGSNLLEAALGRFAPLDDTVDESAPLGILADDFLVPRAIRPGAAAAGVATRGIRIEGVYDAKVFAQISLGHLGQNGHRQRALYGAPRQRRRAGLVDARRPGTDPAHMMIHQQ